MDDQFHESQYAKRTDMHRKDTLVKFVRKTGYIHSYYYTCNSLFFEYFFIVSFLVCLNIFASL